MGRFVHILSGRFFFDMKDEREKDNSVIMKLKKASYYVMKTMERRIITIGTY